MPVYVICGDKVAAFETAPATPGPADVVIGSAAELLNSALTANRFVAIWNALPGVAKVAKF
jgi:hypothetical protein